MDRFYIPPEHWGDSLALTGEEAHHCRRVMRKEVGDEIEVFNGEGDWARGKITALGSKVSLEVISNGHSKKPAVSLELVVGIPKGKTFDLVIQKSVELGVAKIYPLMTDQGMVRIEAKDALKKAEKWNRLSLEACKQCGQNWLPKVSEAKTFQVWCEERSPVDREIVAALTPDSELLREVLPTLPERGVIRVLVGPEGDFSSSEYHQLEQAGAVPVSLGDLVLRVETAVIYLISNVLCQSSR